MLNFDLGSHGTTYLLTDTGPETLCVMLAPSLHGLLENLLHITAHFLKI